MVTRITDSIMAARLEVHPLPPFDPVGNPTSIGQRWKTWTKCFETYIIALDIKDDKQKRALFLYQAGQETQEIFDMLTDTGDDYKTAKEKLYNYFLPKKNVDFETFKLRQITQKTDETIDQFITRLRKLALHCEFHDLDKELKATLIQNCSSKRLRRFREEDVTLEKILAKARALEASESQATGMDRSQASPTEVIQHVHTQGSTTVQETEFWHKLSKQNLSKDHPRPDTRHTWLSKHQR